MTTVQIPEIQVMPYKVQDAVTNMAVDEYLLSLPGTILRFYGWKKPILTFGRLNRMTDDMDLEFCRAAGIQREQQHSRNALQPSKSIYK